MRRPRRLPFVLVRRFGLDRNPLRRRSDRIQAWVRIVALLLLLVACASATALGRTAYDRQLAVERANARSGYQVTGHVVSRTSVVISPDGYPHQGMARVAWQDKAGRRHIGPFVTRTDGDTVSLWIDAHGRASTTAPSGTGALIAGGSAGLCALTTTAGGLAAAYLVLVIVLNRRRSAQWESQWARVEPGWRRQTL